MTILYSIIVISNIHFPSNVIIQENVKVISTSRVSGPKMFGWSVTIEIHGKQYYQVVSYDVYIGLKASEFATINTQKGMWGLRFITSVE